MYLSLRKRFGQRVRELCKSAGFTQEAFADRCGYVRAYMSRIETGGANLSMDAIETLAAALNVPVSKLFENL